MANRVTILTELKALLGADFDVARQRIKSTTELGYMLRRWRAILKTTGIEIRRNCQFGGLPGMSK